MVTRVIEDGRNKCAQYWPTELQTPQQFGIFEVTMSDEEVTKEITNRHFTLKNAATNETKTNIVQLHYTEWPGMISFCVSFYFFCWNV
jgi:protein tyrosine phosphatase